VYLIADKPHQQKFSRLDAVQTSIKHTETKEQPEPNSQTNETVETNNENSSCNDTTRVINFSRFPDIHGAATESLLRSFHTAYLTPRQKYSSAQTSNQDYGNKNINILFAAIYTQ
jgi:hypothetical protein